MEVSCIDLQLLQQQHNNTSLGQQLQQQSANPINVNYNYDGTLLALASKDRVVRIIDPRIGNR